MLYEYVCLWRRRCLLYLTGHNAKRGRCNQLIMCSERSAHRSQIFTPSLVFSSLHSYQAYSSDLYSIYCSGSSIIILTEATASVYDYSNDCDLQECIQVLMVLYSQRRGIDSVSDNWFPEQLLKKQRHFLPKKPDLHDQNVLGGMRSYQQAIEL